MEITYSSNNSGGGWWLSDEDWIALEKAGWWVGWGKAHTCIEGCREDGTCGGHRKAQSAEEAKSHRWLGALATWARKEFATVKECLKEFERITGQVVSDEGCTCCGPPYSFSWDGGYCSGEDCLEYLYDNVPGSFRDAVDKLNKGIK